MDASTQHAPGATFELAALRLHLLAGMAAADETVDAAEVDELHRFVGACDVSEDDRAQLRSMLDALLTSPPALDELLRSIVDRMDRPDLARILIDDLVALANADGVIDPREEGLLRLVCGALEIDPVTLYDPPMRAGADVSAADLAALVRNLLGLDPA